MSAAVASSVRLPAQASIDSYDYRAIALFCACLIYALFGSPTPDSLGIADYVIALLLVISIGIGRARDVIFQPSKRRFWKSAGQVFLLYGLSLPMIVAVLSGHNILDIIRDVIPFLFLFMPLMLLPLLRAKPYYFRSTVVVVVLIGLLFSLRSIVMRYDIGCDLWCSDELLYLENMPTVLFSCLLLIGIGMQALMNGLSIRNIAIFIAVITLAVLPLMAMIVTLQRASVGAVVLYVVILLIYFLYKSPVRGINLIFIGIVTLIVINISFMSVFAPLWQKTSVVGLNMRPQEFEAVWAVISADPWTYMFGIGWGGMFYSPAVGGLSVSFTHNFFTSMLLKCGVLGLILCIAYVWGLMERLTRVILKNIVFGLALLAPILIDLTLYASFKSFDFGLMLLMISGSLVYFRQSESHQI